MGKVDQGADASGRWITIPRTLCFITNGQDVLLMKHAAHKRVFPGRYNGIGGHLERDEDPQSGAVREIQEETGLSIDRVLLRGVCNVDAGYSTGIMLFIFTAESASRDVIACEEGSLHWVPLDQVYDLPLVEDLPYLLPRLFGNSALTAPFFAHAHYDDNDQLIITFAQGK